MYMCISYVIYLYTYAAQIIESDEKKENKVTKDSTRIGWKQSFER